MWVRRRWFLVAALLAGCSENTEPSVDTQNVDVQPEFLVTNLAFAQISGGGSHSCGRTLSTGKLYCWGYNGSGQLGNASLNQKKRPTAVSSTLQFKWVSAGGSHTCAIATDSKAYCWGENYYGQLGDGTTTDRWTPKLVYGGYSWKQIETGGGYSGHTCGLTTGGQLLCWGYNGYGQLGYGWKDYYANAYPRAIQNLGVSYRQFAVGGYHTCAVTTADKAYCWGYAYYGQTGAGGIFDGPTAVQGGLAFRNVTAGQYHTCGTTTGSKAYCWGNGSNGALGNGTTYNAFAPKAVSSSLSFQRLFASAQHTCGQTTGKKPYCWGTNTSGQLGDGTQTKRLTPVAVKTTLLFSQLGTRGNHTCGVQADIGTGYCWGLNTNGQVGDSTLISPRLIPRRVVGAI
jgi:alpha-tubulin suppressor-like RCC1 family protein